MSDTPTDSQFQFVDWSDVAGPSKNEATRLMIRKQAMSKAAAARKQRGDWGKKNISRNKGESSGSSTHKIPERPLRMSGQSTGDDCGLASPPATTGSASGTSDSNDFDMLRLANSDFSFDGNGQGMVSHSDNQAACWTSIPPNMTSTGYELLRLQRGFDLLDLSALTTFHVGRITTSTLHTSPLLLNEVLQCRQWSYMSYVPSRFGHFPCLDDAAQCIASRVLLWIRGEVDINAETLSLYTKALDSLQSALNDPDLCSLPETLCATQLLSIYELLESTQSRGWAQHATGARSLLKLRGPQQIQNSFDRALFIAQIGPIYTEAILENHACFLAEPPWRTALKSLVDDNPITPFSDRGPVVTSLWSLLVRLPTLWKSVQHAVCAPDPLPTAPSDIAQMWAGVMDLTAEVSAWRAKYEPVLRSIPHPASEAAKEEKRFETLGMALVCILILKRLAIALEPLRADARATEEEVEELARDLLALEKTAVAHNPRAGLFMAFKKVAAEAALATKEDWRVSSVVDARVSTSGLIARWVFERWCMLKGRKC